MKNPLVCHHRGYCIQYLGTTDDTRIYRVRLPDDPIDTYDVFALDSTWEHTAAIKDITDWIDISYPDSPAG